MLECWKEHFGRNCFETRSKTNYLICKGSYRLVFLEELMYLIFNARLSKTLDKRNSHFRAQTRKYGFSCIFIRSETRGSFNRFNRFNWLGWNTFAFDLFQHTVTRVVYIFWVIVAGRGTNSRIYCLNRCCRCGWGWGQATETTENRPLRFFLN